MILFHRKEFFCGIQRGSTHQCFPFIIHRTGHLGYNVLFKDLTVELLSDSYTAVLLYLLITILLLNEKLGLKERTFIIKAALHSAWNYDSFGALAFGETVMFLTLVLISDILQFNFAVSNAPRGGFGYSLL